MIDPCGRPNILRGVQRVMTKYELSQCVDSCGDALYGFCMHLTGNRVDADDLFQDTFLTAYEKADRISISDNPESYLIGIAIRLWKNMMRKETRRKRIAGLESFEEKQDYGDKFQAKEKTENTPEELTIHQECNRKLLSYVRELKPVYRIVISLYYESDKTIQEIASIMKVPQGTVKYWLSHSRKILRKKMEEAGYDG
jgi:RNA polymerase sigma-70 factor (ECF subfamily)